jgi:Uma2 family endonuclease
MTALPLPPQRLPLTVAGYIDLGEDPDGVRYELQEGNLVMSPRPTTAHQLCVHEVLYQLREQVPTHLRGVAEVDVDLALVPPGKPGTVRAPDIVVVPRDVLTRLRHDGGVITAHDVVLVVEVLSPGSQRLDTIIKHGEYADAGIPHYWVVDLGEPGERAILTAHHLAGAFGYADAGPAVGVFTATEPFAVRIDLDALA